MDDRLSFSPGRTEKPFLLLGHAFFAVLLGFAVLFVQERLFHFDSAYYTFRIICTGEPNIEHDRWIALFTQWPLLLGLKVGLSYRALLLVYSISLAAFFYLIYLLIAHGLRNTAAGLFLCLALVLSMRYKFYAPVSELVQTIGLLALWLGWVTRPADRWRLPPACDLLIAFGLGALLAGGHAFALIAWFFMLGFFALLPGYPERRRILLGGAVPWLFNLIYFRLRSRSGYETGRLGILDQWKETLAQWDQLKVVDVLVYYFHTQYVLPALLCAGVLIWMVWKGRVWAALWILLGLAFLLGFIVLWFAYLNTEDRLMIDGYLVYLGVVLALPVAFLLVPRQPIAGLLTLAVLLTFSLFRIADQAVYFRGRQAQLLSAIDRHAAEYGPKQMVDLKYFDWDKLWHAWAVGMETLMMTSYRDPGNAATLYFIEPDDRLEPRLDDPSLFLGPQQKPFQFEGRDLPDRCFPLRPGLYRELDSLAFY